MNEKEQEQAPRPPPLPPPQEKAPLVVRVLINLLIGGFVLTVLVFGTCMLIATVH